jgi:hypothetical protein
MTDLRHPVPDKILRLIGDYVVRYSVLIALLRWQLRSYVDGDDKVLQIAANQLSDRQLLDVLAKVHRQSSNQPATDPDLSSFLDRAATEAGNRNRIIHAAWAASSAPDSATLISLDKKRGLRISFENYSPDEMNGHIARLNALIEGFQSWQLNRAMGMRYEDP